MDNAGVLILEDGAEFQGTLFGAPLCSNERDRGYGEVVFNTSMTGYQEILTDPSYYGQMVCMTTPHIGNTGVNSQDPESARTWCAGFLVHDYCTRASSWRAENELDAYMKVQGIPGLSGVDTRALTLHLRSKGVVRGIMLPIRDRGVVQKKLAELPRFEGRDLIAEVSTPKAYRWPSQTKNPRFRVVAMDFGIKWNLLRSMEQQGCDIEVVPASSKSEEILAKRPDGVFLSNGPGDPTAAPYAVKCVSELLGKVPIFGVCMGHQILALALGGKTYKLKFGHRGGNQPVLEKFSGRVEISSHNHGYAVEASSLPSNVEVTHTNLNDHTVEGLDVKSLGAFSVQYHPESCPGPHDSVILFHRFTDLMKKRTMERK